MNKNLAIKASLFLNYFVFAILLNSVGTVILQVQRNFDISKADASLLEGFKDLPIAFFSFIIASFLPKIGIKKGMLIGLALVSIFCLGMPLIADDFWYFKALFVCIGISFAIIKISVFATIGLVTDGTKEHSSLMSLIEGFFMVGVLIGNVIFSLFIDDLNPRSTTWLNVYWILGGLSVLAFMLLLISRLDETDAKKVGSSASEDFIGMLKLVIRPLILIFVASAFLFVLIEQSFQTWMPTFYQDVLNVPASMGVQAGAVLAGAFAVGRILAGIILSKIKWLPFTLFCTGMLAVCVILVMPLTQNVLMVEGVNWFKAPLVVYIFPLMGIFLAPIYPTINSVILSALPKHMHSAMSGLIVVFSALGGTTGSIITGHIFEAFDGRRAFYMSLIPITLLSLTLILLYRLSQRNARDQAGNAVKES